jgi:ribosome-associated protein
MKTRKHPAPLPVTFSSGAPVSSASAPIVEDLFQAEDQRKSRSQLKRESSALQKEGEALAALSPAGRRSLNLPPELEEALVQWKGMKAGEARRRQMQYIGRLMRDLQGE